MFFAYVLMYAHIISIEMIPPEGSEANESHRRLNTLFDGRYRNGRIVKDLKLAANQKVLSTMCLLL